MCTTMFYDCNSLLWPRTEIPLNPCHKQMPSISFITVAECPSYTAIHWCQSGLPCCCGPYLEQSAATCHICTLYVCFPRSPRGLPLQAFLPMTLTAIFVVPAQWQLSFSDTLIVLFFTFLNLYRSIHTFIEYNRWLQYSTIIKHSN